MKKSIFNLRKVLICVCVLIAFAILSQPTQAQTNSKSSSADATVVVKKSVVDNCGRALAELAIYDQLLESKEAEIKLLKERVALELEKFALLREIADARANQASSLIEANKALTDAITAKDAQLQNKDKEIEILKKRKTKLSTIIKAVAAGVSIGLVLK